MIPRTARRTTRPGAQLVILLVGVALLLPSTVGVTGLHRPRKQADLPHGELVALGEDVAAVSDGDLLRAYRRAAGDWQQTAAVDPADVVRSMSLDRVRLAVAAGDEIRVYRVDDGLVLEDRFAPTGGVGIRSDIDLDGSRLAIGDPSHDGADGPSQGIVRLFRRTDAGWGLEAELTHPEASAHDHLGGAVALDGSTLVAGAERRPLDSDVGSAVVYTAAGSWSARAVLAPSDLHGDARFGASVDATGDRVVVGAPGQVASETGRLPDGAVHVFRRSRGSWDRVARITQADDALTGQLVDPDHGVNRDISRFGTDVALTDTTLLVGTPGDAFLLGTGSWECDVHLHDEPASSVAMHNATFVVGQRDVGASVYVQSALGPALGSAEHGTCEL